MKYAYIVAIAILFNAGCSDNEPASNDSVTRVDGQETSLANDGERIKQEKREKSLNEFNEKMKQFDGLTFEEAEKQVKDGNL